MKKLGAIFAALGFILIAAVGCNSSGNDSSSSDGGKSTGVANSNVQVTNALVRQVKVGMTIQEVRDLLGEPGRLLPNKNPNQEGWLYNWGPGVANETVVWFQDGKVLQLPWIDGKSQ